MRSFKIKIYGGEYKIEFRQLDGQGETYLDRGLIYISPEYPLEHQKATLLHEILHICFNARWQYQIEAVSDVKDNSTKEHLLIDPISISIYDVLKDNKNLRRFLFGKDN